MKKVFAFVLLSLALLTAVPVLANDGPAIYLNGEPVSFNGIGVQIVDGRTLVPVRGLFEHMGAQIVWYDGTRSVEVITEDSSINLQIDNEKMVVASKNADEPINVVQLDVPAQIIDGRTMVPLRAISEALGATVGFDEVTYSVRMTTANASEKMDENPDSVKATPLQLTAAETAKWTDVKARWTALKNMQTGAMYAEEPSIEEPFAAGKINGASLQKGVATLNFVRFLAGIPADVTLSDEYTNIAQHTATLLNANGEISYSPPKPNGMDDDFYDLAKGGCTTNIMCVGPPSIEEGILNGFLIAGDSYNITQAGQRRWVLNTSMKETGFGFAGSYMEMYAIDKSRGGNGGVPVVTWPSPGVMPIELFKATDAWSVSLDTSTYGQMDPSNVKVALVRQNDGKTWSITNNDKDMGGKYFNIDTDGFGVANCLIFKPDQIESFRPGDSYTVVITGITKADGTDTKLEFGVKFLSLNEN